MPRGFRDGQDGAKRVWIGQDGITLCLEGLGWTGWDMGYTGLEI